MLERCIRLPAWLLSPATKDVPRHHVVGTTAWLAAGLATFGALSLHAEIGLTDPFLGGGATSAALLLAMAVALTRARSDAASPSTVRSTR
jgi:hypothetical protein